MAILRYHIYSRPIKGTPYLVVCIIGRHAEIVGTADSKEKAQEICESAILRHQEGVAALAFEREAKKRKPRKRILVPKV